MEVIDNRKKKLTFFMDVAIGDYFFSNGILFLKVSPANITTIGAARFVNCVCLEDGSFCHLVPMASVDVIKKITLTVEE